VNLLSAFRPSAWRRLIQSYGKRYYPRYGARFFAAKYIADGVMSRYDMTPVLGANPSRLDYRYYLTRQLAHHAKGIDGLFVSLGVAQGEHSYAIMEKVRPQNPFWLIDSFDGRRSAADATFKEGYVTDVEFVRNRFRQYPNVHILPGLVPGILSKLPDGPIAWAHFNLADAESEIASVKLLGPRLAQSGVIVIDNFGRSSSSPEQRRAYLAAVEEVGRTSLVMPTGHLLVL
jgi:hypothetical protein